MSGRTIGMVRHFLATPRGGAPGSVGQAIGMARHFLATPRGGAPGSVAPQGFTFIELMMASVIATVIAGGTMAAFVTAAKIMREQDVGAYAEANGYAVQAAEQFRNKVGCAQTGELNAWFDGSPACAPTGNIPSTWTTAPLPSGGGTTETIQNDNAVRKYCVVPADCDGVGGVGDCLTVYVKVCWNGTVPGTCPADGAPCP